MDRDSYIYNLCIYTNTDLKSTEKRDFHVNTNSLKIILLKNIIFNF